MCDIRLAIDTLREELGFIDPVYPPGGDLEWLQNEVHETLNRVLDRFWGRRVERRPGRDLDEIITRIEGFEAATFGKHQDITWIMIAAVRERIKELGACRPLI